MPVTCAFRSARRVGQRCRSGPQRRTWAPARRRLPHRWLWLIFRDGNDEGNRTFRLSSPQRCPSDAVRRERATATDGPSVGFCWSEAGAGRSCPSTGGTSGSAGLRHQSAPGIHSRDGGLPRMPGMPGMAGRLRAAGQSDFRTRVSRASAKAVKPGSRRSQRDTAPLPAATNRALAAYRSAAGTQRIGERAFVESSDGIPVGDSTILGEPAGAPPRQELSGRNQQGRKLTPTHRPAEAGKGWRTSPAWATPRS